MNLKITGATPGKIIILILVILLTAYLIFKLFYLNETISIYFQGIK